MGNYQISVRDEKTFYKCKKSVKTIKDHKRLLIHFVIFKYVVIQYDLILSRHEPIIYISNVINHRISSRGKITPNSRVKTP